VPLQNDFLHGLAVGVRMSEDPFPAGNLDAISNWRARKLNGMDIDYCVPPYPNAREWS